MTGIPIAGISAIRLLDSFAGMLTPGAGLSSFTSESEETPEGSFLYRVVHKQKIAFRRALTIENVRCRRPRKRLPLRKYLSRNGSYKIQSNRKGVGMKSVAPSTSETAFNCPHCGAYTTQTWSNTFAKNVASTDRLVFLPGETEKSNISSSDDLDSDGKAVLLNWVDRITSGLVTLDKLDGEYVYQRADNLNISQCYNCNKIAVWVHQKMVFPAQRDADMPSADMPYGVVRDFDEARGIVNESPRGAAALLRLCIQKLCIELGGRGRSIDEDIASLVKKGLNPIVQKSLDVVRVIGNEAVHPGAIDLKDDRDTALKLFKLVNLIVDQMITLPNSISAIYESLPEEKRNAIARRDSAGK